MLVWYKAIESLSTEYNGRLAAEAYGERPSPYERFIDYPVREYPSKLLTRGSALTWEQVNEIVSARMKV